MEFPIKKPPFSSGVFQPATFEDTGRVVGQAMLENIPFTGETTSFQLSFLGISRFFPPPYLIVHYIPLIFQGFSHMFPLFLGMFPYFPIDMLLFSILFPYFPICFPYFKGISTAKPWHIEAANLLLQSAENGDLRKVRRALFLSGWPSMI